MASTDFLKSIFDLSKLPTKFFFTGAVTTGALLFLSKSTLARIHVDGIVTTHGGEIGIIFLGCFMMVAVNCIIWMISKLSRWWIWRNASAHRINLVRKSVEQLDDAEAAVLREYFLQGKSTLKLPIDDATVAGLQKKGILVCVGRLGQGSMVGLLFPMSIDELAQALLTPSLLRFPVPRTDESQRWLLDNRPGFSRRLDDLESLFSGLL